MLFPFSALTLLVGWQEGHPTCKKLDVGLLVVMIWLDFCTAYSSSCQHHFHHPLLQWTSANPGSPGKWTLKRREIYTLCWELLLFEYSSPRGWHLRLVYHTGCTTKVAPYHLLMITHQQFKICNILQQCWTFILAYICQVMFPYGYIFCCIDVLSLLYCCIYV